MHNGRTTSMKQTIRAVRNSTFSRSRENIKTCWTENDQSIGKLHSKQPSMQCTRLLVNGLGYACVITNDTQVRSSRNRAHLQKELNHTQSPRRPHFSKDHPRHCLPGNTLVLPHREEPAMMKARTTKRHP